MEDFDGRVDQCVDSGKGGDGLDAETGGQSAVAEEKDRKELARLLLNRYDIDSQEKMQAARELSDAGHRVCALLGFRPGGIKTDIRLLASMGEEIHMSKFVVQDLELLEEVLLLLDRFPAIFEREAMKHYIGAIIFCREELGERGLLAKQLSAREVLGKVPKKGARTVLPGKGTTDIVGVKDGWVYLKWGKSKYAVMALDMWPRKDLKMTGLPAVSVGPGWDILPDSNSKEGYSIFPVSEEDWTLLEEEGVFAD